jgi:hypothetical protein
LTTKTTLEWSDNRRQSVGMKPAVHELLYVRERWAMVANEALREANIDARIDHRTLAAQGIDREPYPYIPRAAFEMERQGYRSFQAERLRAEYEERLLAREARALPEQSAARQVVSRELEVTRTSPQSLEDVRRIARENWLKYKENSAQRTADAAERSRDDDLSL